jgi:hypothetical protein
VHVAFHAKIAAAVRDKASVAAQDWTGITAIIQTILGAFE